MNRRPLKLTDEAREKYRALKAAAKSAAENRTKTGKTGASREEGLFEQVHKTLDLLATNIRYPGLMTHKYDEIKNPVRPHESVFEAYAQNRTPGAYRVFWCYGPGKDDITIIAITPHP